VAPAVLAVPAEPVVPVVPADLVVPADPVVPAEPVVSAVPAEPVVPADPVVRAAPLPAKPGPASNRADRRAVAVAVDWPAWIAASR